MTLSDLTLEDAWRVVGPFIPPTVGAYLGLRHARQQSRGDQAISWAGSTVAGIWLGGMATEIWHLGPYTSVGCGFLIAMFGSEMFAAVVAAIRQVASDPAGAAARWRAAIWPGGNVNTDKAPPRVDNPDKGGDR